ncbi:ABC transporter family substrate-binding protein [Kitasatospora sp. NPDC059571]|uniref:ABC transporter family substrate-binding protein n=1 Tax=Kitasatospora sp. NPDC059571 TaxID=3346871 RepID=UPI0036B89215
MTKPRFPLALTASAAALALALCACSSTGSADAALDARSRAGGPGAPRMTQLSVNAQPRTALRRGGTLQWAIDQLPTQWNPLQVDGAEPATTAVMKALLPTFWRSDASGGQSPDTDFLLDAKESTAAGHQTVVWTLNPKARWSDGTPITWRDLEATWKALNGADPQYRSSSTAGFDRVGSVTRGQDDFQAVMTFDKPFSEWQAMFNNVAGAPLLPARYTDTPDGFNTAFLDRIPVTAGPFRPASVDRTAQTVTLEPDPSWWGDRPLLDRIVFRAMDAGAMADAFARGQVDYFDIGPDAAAYRKVLATPDGEVRKAGSPNTRALVLNGRSPQLADPAVRRAVVQAIDREAVAHTALQGLDWTYTPANNHFLVPGQNGYRDNSGGLSQYDVDAADQALEAAGWHRPGFAMRSKDGRPLTLRLVVPAGSPAAAGESNQILEMLALAGIQVDITTVPAAAFFETYVNRHDFDLTLVGLFGTPFPATSSSGTFQQDAGANAAQVGSRALDRALADAASAASTGEEYDAINRADAEAWQVAGLVPLYQRPAVYGVRRSVANLGAPGLTDPVYENIGFQK